MPRIRIVRTAEGAARYGVPIGSPIPSRSRDGAPTRSVARVQTRDDGDAAGRVLTDFKPKRGVTGAKGDKYLAEIQPRSTAAQRAAIGRYLGGGHADIHAALREGREHPDVPVLDSAMQPLPDDLIVSRLVPADVFGPQVDDMDGMRLRDAAYAPTVLGAGRGRRGMVRMRISVPAGTRAMVHPESGELILDRDLELGVTKVEPGAGGGTDMHMVVLRRAPSASRQPEPATSDVVPEQPAAPPPADVPEPQPQAQPDRDPPSTQPPGPAQPPAQPAVEAQPDTQQAVVDAPPAARVTIRNALNMQTSIAPGTLAHLRGVTIPTSPDTSEARAFEILDQPLGFYLPAAVDEDGITLPGQMIILHPEWGFDRSDPDGAESERRDKAALAAGWFVPRPDHVDGLTATIAHETGHHIVRMFTGDDGSDNFTSIRADAARHLLPALDEELGTDFTSAIDRVPAGSPIPGAELDAAMARNRGRIGSMVSWYANTEFHELLAELWSEYTMMGERARPAAARIGDLMRLLAEANARIFTP